MSTFNLNSNPKRKSLISRIRQNVKRTMVSGLIALIPLTATVVVLSWLLTWLDSFAAPVIRGLLGLDTRIPGLGILLMLVVIYLAGFVASNVLGRRVISWFEGQMMRLPVARRVYQTIKKLLDTFTLEGEAQVWKTVLVEYPRRDAWMVAFFVGEIPSEERRDELVSVFVPNTPNPAAGRVVIVPRRDVIPVDLPVEEALEFVVSGGTSFSNLRTLPSLRAGETAASLSREETAKVSREEAAPVSRERAAPVSRERAAPVSRERAAPVSSRDQPV